MRTVTVPTPPALVALRDGRLSVPLIACVPATCNRQVVKGKSAVDESALTGESVPKEKDASKADCRQVFSGTVVTNGYLQIRTDKLAAEGSMAKIATAVTDLQACGPRADGRGGRAGVEALTLGWAQGYERGGEESESSERSPTHSARPPATRYRLRPATPRRKRWSTASPPCSRRWWCSAPSCSCSACRWCCSAWGLWDGAR